MSFSWAVLDVSLYALAVFYVFAAYLNLNDPDPEIWVSLYLLAAAVMVSSTLSETSAWRTCWAVPHTLALVTTIEAHKLYVSVPWPSLKDWFDYLDMEVGREVCGLLLLAFGMLLALYRLTKDSFRTIPYLHELLSVLVLCLALFGMSEGMWPHYLNASPHCGPLTASEDVSPQAFVQPIS